MADWWNQLSLELQIFYGIGIISLFFTLVQTTLTLIGIGAESADFDMDIGDTQHGTGIGLFSTQTIAAFFLGFGWGGVLCLKIGLHPLVAVFLAFNLGGILMAMMYFLLVGMLSLQSKGNMDYSTAIGAIGEVYVTIPAKRSGRGKIQVMIGGRLMTADAETDSPASLRPGQNIRVVERIGHTDFLVKEK